MNSIELVVFDMAGTTVVDNDAVHSCLCASMATVGLLVSRDDANEVMGLPKPIAIRLMLEKQTPGKSTIDEADVARIHNEFEERMLTFYRTDSGVREIDGASEIFRKLRDAGIKVSLDTGFNRAIAEVIVKRLGWETGGLIDAVVTSDEVAQGRPHPDMIYRAMELTGVMAAGRVAKVGDTPSDLLEGSAAGCGWVVGVTEGSHTREQLAVFPHTHLIRAVVDLPDCLPINL